MTPSHAPTTAFAGLDVGKAFCQLAILLPEGTTVQRPIPTTPDGFAQMVELCQKHQVALVVMECTGRLEIPPAVELWHAGIPVSIISPRQSHAFAKALGRAAKTDRLDADLLARFAQRIRPNPTEKLSEYHLELREWATRRRQLMGMLIQEKNRLAQARAQSLQENIQRHLRLLTQQLDAVDQQIHDHLQRDPQLHAAVARLESVPGISRIAATQLIVALPELGTLTRRTVASLAGLAPMAHDSGTLAGPRAIRGGRANARTALFMPALCATRFNPVIKAMYTRLRAAGQRPIVALIACMRKLLIILNSMLKQHKTWDQFILKNTSQSA